MTGADIIAIIVIALVVGAAVFYIVRSRRRGGRCIGCPSSRECSGHCEACSAKEKER